MNSNRTSSAEIPAFHFACGIGRDGSRGVSELSMFSLFFSQTRLGFGIAKSLYSRRRPLVDVSQNFLKPIDFIDMPLTGSGLLGPSCRFAINHDLVIVVSF
jgi:hypothetical protein